LKGPWMAPWLKWIPILCVYLYMSNFPWNCRRWFRCRIGKVCCARVCMRLELRVYVRVCIYFHVELCMYVFLSLTFYWWYYPFPVACTHTFSLAQNTTHSLTYAIHLMPLFTRSPHTSLPLPLLCSPFPRYFPAPFPMTSFPTLHLFTLAQITI